MKLETRPFDAAEYLTGESAGAEYLSAALETGDADFIAEAFATVMRAHGMGALAKETGRSRSALYQAFAKGGNPTLETLLAVMGALGMKLAAVPEKAAA